MGETSGSKGHDPNEERDDERARGEDPRLADLKSVKEHAAEEVPFKITHQG